MHTFIVFFFCGWGRQTKTSDSGMESESARSGIYGTDFFLKVEWGEKNTLDAVQHRVKELKVITGAATRGRRLGVHAR